MSTQRFEEATGGDDVDIMIVGAGISGLYSALRLLASLVATESQRQGAIPVPHRAAAACGEPDRAIAALPQAIFDILRSPDGQVQIDASGMLMSASGDAASAVGDSFVMHVDRDSLRDFDLGEYDVTVVMTAFDQNSHIEWTIESEMDPPLGHVYGYRLESIDGGTKVTSYCDWSNLHEANAELAAEHFPIISETNLRATLGILARTVAPGAGRPGA